ncbi:ABC transporter ATP-binding protein [Pseudanabaena sp. FACHB-2040]|uniref:ABC transporter ATP-binding protein n=1 Tax=Pseudanabaena sp. FACHB-2040 TaxID=2692859 RepID=UPI001683E555|nr:ABC transporter ATP-binding protein [Pseudanabaena sp. FACHB-2040]MBD2258345.1 ABC transporter ATP-binding protein [Pseudanabaena sp. FACHB-2040]
MQTTPIPVKTQAALLSVENLTVEFRTRSGVVKALESVSFAIQPGETVGIVGESGSGKSVTAFTLMGVLDRAGRVTKGQALLQTGEKNVDLLAEPESALRQLRGKELSMIFQNPRTALNPIRKVGKQIEDVLRCHSNLPSADLKTKAIDLLSSVRIPDAEKRYDAYPYELSGGLCQRIMIALALACSPKLLIADEPTTGLDVTTQATVMNLLKDLAEQRQMATVLITHDLALASEYCDRIVVMHAGHVVELAPTHALFAHPRHPYTAKLIAATPEPHKTFADLVPIPGNLPDLKATDLPPCRFSQRCDRYETNLCDQPPLTLDLIDREHFVACQKPL